MIAWPMRGLLPGSKYESFSWLSAAPVSAVVQQLVEAVVAAGRSEEDYSTLAKTLFELAGLDRAETSGS